MSEQFGHVTLVQGYALPTFVGSHALVKLRDSPDTIAFITTDPGLQHLLETGLATGKLVAIWGEHLTNPPTPLGGTWSLPVWSMSSMIVYA